MDSVDLKLITIFYIREDETLTESEKVQLMDYVEEASDDEVLFLLGTGNILGESSSDIMINGDAMHISEEKPWGPTTYNPMIQSGISVGTNIISSASSAYGLKLNKKYVEKMQTKCDKEKGLAKKTCHNKVKRDGIRVEIKALSSMKVKCRKAKNAETCIQNIDKRIKELQNRMDSIKVF